jgi:hypothetical protein
MKSCTEFILYIHDPLEQGIHAGPAGNGDNLLTNHNRHPTQVFLEIRLTSVKTHTSEKWWQFAY